MQLVWLDLKQALYLKQLQRPGMLHFFEIK